MFFFDTTDLRRECLERSEVGSELSGVMSESEREKVKRLRVVVSAAESTPLHTQFFRRMVRNKK